MLYDEVVGAGMELVILWCGMWSSSLSFWSSVLMLL